MLEVTPLLEKATHNELAELISIGLPYARRKAIQLFLLYLIDEDARYCVIPDHPQYNDQRKLVERLNQQVTELARPARTSHATRFGRPFGVVTSWFDEHGYGFIAPEGGGRKVFLHICDIMNINTDTVTTGTIIEYEKVDTHKGPKAVDAAIIE
jgi:cold shock protein